MTSGLAFTILLLLAIGLATSMMLREAWHFRRSTSVQRLRRLTLRMSMGGMLVFLLASLLIGLQLFHLKEPDGVVYQWIAFWGCIFILTGGILCLAIADLRTIGDDTLEQSKDHWTAIAQAVAEHEKSQSKD